MFPIENSPIPSYSHMHGDGVCNQPRLSLSLYFTQYELVDFNSASVNLSLEIQLPINDLCWSSISQICDFLFFFIMFGFVDEWWRAKSLEAAVHRSIPGKFCWINYIRKHESIDKPLHPALVLSDLSFFFFFWNEKRKKLRTFVHGRLRFSVSLKGLVFLLFWGKKSIRCTF